jgi:hypothetical protein
MNLRNNTGNAANIHISINMLSPKNYRQRFEITGRFSLFAVLERSRSLGSRHRRSVFGHSNWNDGVWGSFALIMKKVNCRKAGNSRLQVQYSSLRSPSFRVRSHQFISGRLANTILCGRLLHDSRWVIASPRIQRPIRVAQPAESVVSEERRETRRPSSENDRKREKELHAPCYRESYLLRGNKKIR